MYGPGRIEALRRSDQSRHPRTMEIVGVNVRWQIAPNLGQHEGHQRQMALNAFIPLKCDGTSPIVG